jgi:DNA-binding transcriptional regulator YiaG
MTLYITKKQLADALGETAIALTMAMPELVKAINQNNPAIAAQQVTNLAKVTELSESPYASMFMTAMLGAIENWENPAVSGTSPERH